MSDIAACLDALELLANTQLVDARAELAHLQQLQSGQAPGPCGQEGHLMLHRVVKGGDGTDRDGQTLWYECSLCERQAKLLEAAERTLSRVQAWDRRVNDVVVCWFCGKRCENASQKFAEFVHRDDCPHHRDEIAIREARAAAAIAEEMRK